MLNKKLLEEPECIGSVETWGNGHVLGQRCHITTPLVRMLTYHTPFSHLLASPTSA